MKIERPLKMQIEVCIKLPCFLMKTQTKSNTPGHFRKNMELFIREASDVAHHLAQQSLPSARSANTETIKCSFCTSEVATVEHIVLWCPMMNNMQVDCMQFVSYFYLWLLHNVALYGHFWDVYICVGNLARNLSINRKYYSFITNT